MVSQFQITDMNKNKGSKQYSSVTDSLLFFSKTDNIGQMQI